MQQMNNRWCSTRIGIIGTEPEIGWLDDQSPSDVAKTIVAASEPRLPTMRTGVEMAAPVALVKVSTVLEKSSKPTDGTVTSRCTSKPR